VCFPSKWNDLYPELESSKFPINFLFIKNRKNISGLDFVFPSFGSRCHL
jgi:hypothetical protein